MKVPSFATTSIEVIDAYYIQAVVSLQDHHSTHRPRPCVKHFREEGLVIIQIPFVVLSPLFICHLKSWLQLRS